MEIHAVHLSFIADEELLKKLLVYASPIKRAKINKFHRLEDKFRSLIADILLRVVMCKLLSITDQEFNLKLAVNCYGKPYLKDSSTHFNLSHSGDWVLLVTDVEPVGVDIEEQLTIDFDIAKSFFASAEYADLSSLPYSQKTTYFYSLWTLKEALIKADGRGLAIGLNTFSFSLCYDQINLDPGYCNFPQYYFRQYDIDPKYSLSVCAMNDKFPKYIHFWNIEHLTSKIQDLYSSRD